MLNTLGGAGVLQQVTRDNHIVPQWYLSPWATPSGEVWRYRLLVSRANIGEWDLCQRKGVAYQRDMYTSVESGEPSDDFERWLTTQFELPAQAALLRVLGDQPLGPDHWQHLGRFALSQKLRTLAAYLEWTEWAAPVVDKVMEKSLRRGIAAIEESQRTGQPVVRRRAPKSKHLEGSFVIDIEPASSPDAEFGQVGARMLLDRETWFRHQRHVADGSGWVAALLDWSIAAPADGFRWFTSDVPVVMTSHDGSTFDVGWKTPNAHIMLPLSPQHMLYAHVGERLPAQLRLTADQTRFFMAVQARRAHLAIFADRRSPEAAKLRPRVVDARAFVQQEAARLAWHSSQVAAREEFDDRRQPT